MTHQASRNPPLSQASTIQTAAPPSRKIQVTTCSSRCCSLIGVSRSNSIYYFFENKNGKLVPHVCSCQTKTIESDLLPLYSEWSDKLGETVIFVYNRVTSKVEQYVCREEFGQLEQVEKSGLIYNSGYSAQCNIVASIDVGDKSILIERDSNGSLKKCLKFGERFTYLPSTEVRTMIVKELEEEGEDSEDENDSEDEENEDSEYNDYISKISKINITECLHTNKDIIHVFDSRSETYKSFCYEQKTGDFYPFVCNSCPKTVVEDHLFPKYHEVAKSGEYVIHVYNSFTRLMEKYSYYATTRYFKQGSYPELVYDPSKDLTASLLFVTTQTPATLAVMRDSDGRMKKEQFSAVKNQFVKMPPATVKTFIVLKKEEMAKKKEEEKKKKQEEEKKEEEKKKKEQEKKEAEKPKKNEVISVSSSKTSQPSVPESSECPPPSVKEIPKERKEVSQEQLPKTAPQEKKQEISSTAPQKPLCVILANSEPTLGDVVEARQVIADLNGMEKELEMLTKKGSEPCKKPTVEELQEAIRVVLAYTRGSRNDVIPDSSSKKSEPSTVETPPQLAEVPTNLETKEIPPKSKQEDQEEVSKNQQDPQDSTDPFQARHIVQDYFQRYQERKAALEEEERLKKEEEEKLDSDLQRLNVSGFSSKSSESPSTVLRETQPLRTQRNDTSVKAVYNTALDLSDDWEMCSMSTRNYDRLTAERPEEKEMTKSIRKRPLISTNKTPSVERVHVSKQGEWASAKESLKEREVTDKEALASLREFFERSNAKKETIQESSQYRRSSLFPGYEKTDESTSSQRRYQ
uniref:Mono(ADP-ribosyl)transferase n=1 Tax=Caenorhabditis tropicalis TaxID=1561998 RepID=A0A1I7UNU1_9PELO